MRVPSYEQKVSIDAPNVPVPKIPIAPEGAFGGEVAQATTNMGNTLGKISNQVLARIEERNKIAKNQQIEDAYATYSDEMQEELLSNEVIDYENEDGSTTQKIKGKLNRKLQDSVGTTAEVELMENDAFQRASSRFENDPESYAKFAAKRETSRRNYREVTQKHEAREYELLNETLKKDNVAKQIKSAALSQSPEQLNASIKNTSDTVKRYNEFTGKPEETIQNEIDTAVAEVINSSVQASLSSDVDGKIGELLLDSVKSNLSDKEYNKIKKDLLTTSSGLKKQKEEQGELNQLSNLTAQIKGLINGKVTEASLPDLFRMDMAKDLPDKSAKAFNVALTSKKNSKSLAMELDVDAGLIDYTRKILEAANPKEISTAFVELLGDKKIWESEKGQNEAKVILKVISEFGNETRKAANDEYAFIDQYQKKAGIKDSRMTVDYLKLLDKGASPKEARDEAIVNENQRQVASNEKDKILNQRFAKAVVSNLNSPELFSNQFGRDMVQYLLKIGVPIADAEKSMSSVSFEVKDTDGYIKILDKLREVAPGAFDKGSLFKSIYTGLKAGQDTEIEPQQIVNKNILDFSLGLSKAYGKTLYKTLGEGEQLVGQAIQWYGDSLEKEIFVPKIDKKYGGYYAASELKFSKELGKKIKDYGTKMIKQNKVMMDAAFPDEYKGWEKFAADLGSGTVSIFAGLGIGVLTGGAGSGAAFGLAQKFRKYDELINSERASEEAERLSNLYAIVEGVPEFFGIETLLKSGGKLLYKGAVDVVTNIGQEFIQSAGEAELDLATGLRANEGLKTQKDIIVQALYEGSIGGLLALPASIAIHNSSKNKIAKILEDNGATKKQAEKMTKDMMKTYTEETVSPAILNAVIDLKINSLNEEQYNALLSQDNVGLKPEDKQEAEDILKRIEERGGDTEGGQGAVLPTAPETPITPAEVAPKVKSESDEKGSASVSGLIEGIANTINTVINPEKRLGLYQEMINRNQSLEELSKTAKKEGVNVPKGEDPGLQANKSLSSVGQANGILEYGTVKYDKDGNATKTGEGLKIILNEFDANNSVENKSDVRLEDLNTYLKARRVEDLAKLKRKKAVVDADDIAKAKGDLEAISAKYGPEVSNFENTAKRLYEFQKRVLNLLVDSGGLSQEQFNKILEEHPNYIPFDRILVDESEEATKGTGKEPFSNVRTPIKKIKGSKLEIQEVIGSVMKNTYKIVDAYNRNKVFKDVYNLADIKALNIEKMPPNFMPISVSEEEANGEAITIFRPSQFKPTGTVVEGFIDGKRKYLKVTKNVYDAMMGLNEQSSSLLTKILLAPAQFTATALRTGATLTPEFIARNFIRDQFTALIQTQVGFKPFIDTIAAISDITDKSEMYQRWLESGGAFSGFIETSRPAMVSLVKKLRSEPSVLKRMNIIAGMQDASKLIEQATRLAVFKAAKKQGKSDSEAGFISAESTLNFSRRGSNPVLAGANKITAFLNASIQAFDKTNRTLFQDDPAGATLKSLAAITIPSMLLYLVNKDDEDYKELPRWQKDLFWCIKVNEGVKKTDDLNGLFVEENGSVWIRIPKPFAYGQVFGSIPERFMEYMFTQDKDSFQGLAESLIDSLSPIAGDVMGIPIPTIAKPLIENETNWSFFKDRALMPDYATKYIEEEQYTKYTSETAKVLGRMTGASPTKIENTIVSWSGGAGRYALQAGDLGIDQLRKKYGFENPPKRPTELADLPVVKGFVAREPIGFVSQSVSDFYKNFEEIEKLKNTYKRYNDTNRPETAQKFYEDNPLIDMFKTANNAKRDINKMSKQVDEIVSDTTLSDKEKKSSIREIEKNMVIRAKEVNKEIKEMRSKK